MFQSILKSIRTLPALAFAGLCLCAVPAAAKSPIPDIRDSYGVALADFDGDDLLDVYIVGFRTLNRLLINNGDGTFHDKSIPAGVGGNLMPQGIRNLELGASAVDFDNDGAVDILICGWGDALDLLKNRKDGTFFSVTKRTGLQRDVDANMAIWGDLDNDGYLDPLLTNEKGPVRLYRNDHGLRFLPINLDSAGIASDSGSQGAAWVDLDLDGDLDLVVTGWNHPLRIYEQIAPFKFREVNLGLALPALGTLPALGILPTGTLPSGTRCNAVLVGDFDGDGDPDLLVTVKGGTNLLLVNQADPPRTAGQPADWHPVPKPIRFLEKAQALGLKDTLDTYGGAFGDFDGDGDLDLFLTTRNYNHYYENVGGRFVARDLAEADVDDDQSYYNTGFMFGDLTPAPGDEMVIISRDSASAIQEGPIPMSRRVKIRLHGVQSNRDGIGSAISLWGKPLDEGNGNGTVTAAVTKAKGTPVAGGKVSGSPDADAWTLEQSFQTQGGSGYLSSYVGPLSVYLPDSQNVQRLRVRFPGGKVVVRRINPNDTLIEVWESGAVSAAWERGSRAVYNALRDPAWRRKILLSALAIAVIAWLLRATVRAMAGNIARKQYTQELVHKNRELQDMIQEVNRTQQQLIHSEKLAALGQLVAGIAHELNNPIGFIYANMFQIRKYLDNLERGPLDDASRAVVRKIDQALRDSQDGSIRIRDIVQNLRGLSRAGSPGPGPGNILRKRPCDVNELIDKSLLLAQTNFSKNIRIEKAYGAVPLVEADETQIQQVFLNVLVNAGHALGEKGRIRIATKAERGMAVVTISDDGPGISPDNLQHLFEPFFTTKPVGQGIGLGLHICYQIMSAHQGKIEARSLSDRSSAKSAGVADQGAEFVIQLPLTLPNLAKPSIYNGPETGALDPAPAA